MAKNKQKQNNRTDELKELIVEQARLLCTAKQRNTFEIETHARELMKIESTVLRKKSQD